MINVPGVSEDTDPMIQGPHVFFCVKQLLLFPHFFHHLSEFTNSELHKSRNEALSPAMSLPDWLGHGYANIGENAPKVLATGNVMWVKQKALETSTWSGATIGSMEMHALGSLLSL